MPEVGDNRTSTPTPATRRLPRDPTHPLRWPEQQVRGRVAFQIQYGVLCLGLPLAVLFDVVLLLARGDAALFFSAHHAIQLLAITMTVGVIAGLVLGRILWRVGERRYGDALLTREFYGDREE